MTGEPETPRLDPAPEKAGLPEEGMPSSEETPDDLLDVVEAENREADVDAHRMAADLGIELPEDPDLALVLVLRALAESRSEAGEYLAMMQRVAADFDNYRKRVERDHADSIMRASQRVIERLLPALDSFDAALAYEPQSPSEEKILDGMRGTHTQLMDILGNEGLVPVAAVGEPFDPAVHEAAAGPEGEGDGTLVVAKELRRGYTVKGRVVRPSLVVVEHA